MNVWYAISTQHYPVDGEIRCELRLCTGREWFVIRWKPGRIWGMGGTLRVWNSEYDVDEAIIDHVIQAAAKLEIAIKRAKERT